MTVEAKALVDLTSEQTSAAGTDLLFVESAGTPSKITKANILGANLTGFAAIDPATVSHRLISEIEITKGVDTPVATINEAIPAAYETIQIIFDEFEGSVTNSILSLRVGVNGDAGPFVTTSSYVTQSIFGESATAGAALQTRGEYLLTGAISNAAQNLRGFGDATLYGLNQTSALTKLTALSGGANSTPANQVIDRMSREETLGNYNGIQFFSFGGNIVNLRLKIYGVL